MIPWIQVYSNLPQHPKTTRLADELGLTSAALNPNVLAVGMVVSLWAWAIQNAHDGDLSGCSARAIADACQWKKKPETLVKALHNAGFLDADMKLHNWDDYTVMYQDLQEDSKIKHRERQRRYREKKKGDVTVTSPCDESDAIPNQTKPNLTNIFSGGDDARARAQEDVSLFAQSRDLDMDAYFGVTPEIRAKVDALTQEIFNRFTTRQPTQIDQAHVFRSVMEQSVEPEWSVCLSENRKGLLLYACEAAAKAGKPGDWNYIDGVLVRLHQRGISTLDEAEDYDISRDQARGGTD
ncbi:MAG: DnaD domain protein [Oscillospiraceae bacterium]|nr:DnaD domain protein [Oscillospiraceae bacterium]